MPCYSAAQPSEAEIECQFVSGCICFLFDQLGRPVPDWARNSAECGNASKVNEATALLCETVRSLPRKELIAILKLDSRWAQDLALFWGQHEEFDRRRLEREEQARQQDESEFERLRRKLGK